MIEHVSNLKKRIKIPDDKLPLPSDFTNPTMIASIKSSFETSVPNTKDLLDFTSSIMESTLAGIPHSFSAGIKYACVYFPQGNLGCKEWPLNLEGLIEEKNLIYIPKLAQGLKDFGKALEKLDPTAIWKLLIASSILSLFLAGLVAFVVIREMYQAQHWVRNGQIHNTSSSDNGRNRFRIAVAVMVAGLFTCAPAGATLVLISRISNKAGSLNDIFQGGVFQVQKGGGNEICFTVLLCNIGVLGLSFATVLSM